MAQTEARQVLESLGFKAGGQSRYMVRINRACLHLALPFRPSVAKVMRMSVRLHLALQLRILRQSVARVMKVLSLSLSPSLMNMSVRLHLVLRLWYCGTGERGRRQDLSRARLTHYGCLLLRICMSVSGVTVCERGGGEGGGETKTRERERERERERAERESREKERAEGESEQRPRAQ